MSYLKKWRKIHADVQALAQSSSSSSDELEDLEPADTDTGLCQTADAPATQQNIHDANFDEDQSANLHEDFNDSYSNHPYTDSGSDALSDPDAELDEEPDIAVQLAEWTTRNSCSRAANNELLAILQGHGHRLPKDARTLLNTPRNTGSIKKCGGDYTYFG